MHTRYRLILIGGDTAMRASLSSKLSDSGWRVTPAESYDEIGGSPIEGGVVLCLVSQTGDVARIQQRMDQLGAWMPIIACPLSANPRLVTDSVQAGSQGHLSWPIEVEDLAEVVAAAEGGMLRYVRMQNSQAEARRKLARLTPREREVLHAMIRHGSNKLIAKELGLSPRTVEVYRAKIMQRLDADHLVQAIWIAYQSGEQELPPAEGPKGASTAF